MSLFPPDRFNADDFLPDIKARILRALTVLGEAPRSTVIARYQREFGTMTDSGLISRALSDLVGEGLVSVRVDADQHNPVTYSIVATKGTETK